MNYFSCFQPEKTLTIKMTICYSKTNISYVGKARHKQIHLIIRKYLSVFYRLFQNLQPILIPGSRPHGACSTTSPPIVTE